MRTMVILLMRATIKGEYLMRMRTIIRVRTCLKISSNRYKSGKEHRRTEYTFKINFPYQVVKFLNLLLQGRINL